MTIQEIKTAIENKTIDHSLIIFVNSENDFIANQYIAEISKILELQTIGIEENELSSLNQGVSTLFGDIESSYLRICRISTFKFDSSLMGVSDLIIVCNKVDAETSQIYKSFIVNIPKIEDWQLKDYTYSVADGVSENKLDKLMSLCHNNLYRLDSELKKLSIFTKEERNYVFDEFLSDGMYEDLTDATIFNLVDALISKNMKKVASIYPHIRQLGKEDIHMLLLTVLLKNIRNYILVKTQPHPTPENTELTDKQIYAIKKSPLALNEKQLYKAFNFLSDIDRRIKCGDIDTKYLTDYLIVFMLTL